MSSISHYSPPLDIVIAYELTTTVVVVSFTCTLLFALRAARSTRSNGTKWIRKMEIMERIEAASLVLIMILVLLQCAVTIWKAAKVAPGLQITLSYNHGIARVVVDGAAFSTRVHEILTVVPLVTTYIVKLLYLTYFFSSKIFPHLSTPYRLFLYLVSILWACSFVCSVLLVVLWCHPLYAGDDESSSSSSMKRRHIAQDGCWVGVDFQAGAVVGMVDLIGTILLAAFGIIILTRVRNLRAQREEAPLTHQTRIILAGLLALGLLSIASCAGRLGLTLKMLERALQGKDDVNEYMLLWVQVLGRVEIVFGLLPYVFRLGSRGGERVGEFCSSFGKCRRGPDEETEGVRRSIEATTGRCFDYVKGELVEYREASEVDRKDKDIELVHQPRININH
ncbi:hypothetical protein BJ508DRAFT_356970 [Ascobolus immersus RN42]|uniref:Uncharacterized protein n=1 Tax=Ascobolus immersus RN42 TaxID=1160509 RepID=A0A3N4J2Y1_ASCIM|nr:hypothetical protein BJ508DRAFT_356970 [Ascobolus immersus RN42]